MSFSKTTKEELMAVPQKHRCCRRALAFGLLVNAETDGERIVVDYSSNDIADFAVKTMRSVFGDGAVAGRNGCTVALVSDVAANFLKNSAKSSYKPDFFACPTCAQRFLSGVFIASGSLTDPAKQYHFELLINNENRANFVAETLENCVAAPGFIKRNGGVGLFYKKSSTIEDVLSLFEANNAYFAFVNGKIERDIRNDANRASNCEMRNIERSVKASQRYIDAIESLVALGEFEKLPNDLKETASARLKYPDLPLSELAKMHVPPITKSGLDHRLKRILSIYEKLK